MDRIVSKFKLRASKGQDEPELTPFRHSPLDPNEPEAIRLIRIKPERRNGLIDCELWHATIKAEYCTLSYVCGDTDRTHEIFLNGKPYYVRTNLLRFLGCARDQFSDKTFWIDALCIHQNDVHERSHQVQMMSKIYTETQEVHVWLGADTNNGSYALDQINACSWVTGERTIEIWRNGPFLTGFRAIHDAQYWDRAWCLQEFVLPPAGLLIMGTSSVPLEVFDCFIQNCYDALEAPTDNACSQEIASDDFLAVIDSRGRDLWLMRKQRLQSGPDQDMPSIRFLEPRACSDIRDRIYSALPFHKWETGFRVDYLLSPFELLLEYMTKRLPQPITDTANLLNLTPITVMLYTQPLRNFRVPGGRHRVILLYDAEKLHLQSAASAERSWDWVRLGVPHPAKSISRKWIWQDAKHVFPKLSIFKTLKQNLVEFHLLHNIDQCVILKHNATDVYLILATTPASYESGDERNGNKLPDVQDLTQGSSCCLVSGRYTTKCADEPEIVCFALLEDPELRFETPRDDLAVLSMYPACKLKWSRRQSSSDSRAASTSSASNDSVHEPQRERWGRSSNRFVWNNF